MQVADRLMVESGGCSHSWRDHVEFVVLSSTHFNDMRTNEQRVEDGFCTI